MAPPPAGRGGRVAHTVLLRRTMLEGGTGRVVIARLPMEGARGSVTNGSANLIERVLEEGGPEAALECEGLKSVLMVAGG